MTPAKIWVSRRNRGKSGHGRKSGWGAGEDQWERHINYSQITHILTDNITEADNTHKNFYLTLLSKYYLFSSNALC
jgi:hypothetical protein